MSIEVQIAEGVGVVHSCSAKQPVTVACMADMYGIDLTNKSITVNSENEGSNYTLHDGDKVALTVPVRNNLYGVEDTISHGFISHGYVDVAASLLAVVTAIVIADKAYDEYKSATAFLEEVNDRRLEFSRYLFQHQMTVTYPMQKQAMDEAFAMPVFSPDKVTQCIVFKESMMDSLSKANQAQSHYNKLFCLKNPSCNNELGYYAGIAASEQSFYRGQQQDLRYTRNLEEKTNVIHQAHAGTFRSPSAIFGLLENAASTAGYIQGQAWSNLSGALSVFGMGVNGLINAFGS